MKRRVFLQSTAGLGAGLALGARTGLALAQETEQQTFSAIDAIRGDGGHFTLPGSSVKDLRDALRGRLLMARSEGYEEARRIRNLGIDKHPALIVQATGAADVSLAVNFARENKLLLAVKCGGHSFSGQSTCDGGMMIDLSNMRAVRVDPGAKRAWVSGGTLLGHVDHETMAHDLVTTLGTVSDTGVGGLTTGGGLGRVGRRFGLAIDNVVSVDIVTADGKLRRASATENPDLFWGVRGGGGNFGVVTAFEFQLHPMQRQVIGGTLSMPFAKPDEILKRYAELCESAPDDLDVGLIFSPPQPDSPDGLLAFDICFCGDPRDAQKVLEPLRRIGRKGKDEFRAIDYVALQRSGDEGPVDPRNAFGGYMKGGFIRGLSPDLIKAIVEGGNGIIIGTVGGAASQVPEAATAFAHRYATHNIITGAGWRIGEDSKEPIRRLHEFWAGIVKYTGGFYVNDIGGDETAATIDANYRGNYPRLVELKNKYDPSNLFRLNANVRPTV